MRRRHQHWTRAIPSRPWSAPLEPQLADNLYHPRARNRCGAFRDYCRVHDVQRIEVDAANVETLQPGPGPRSADRLDEVTCREHGCTARRIRSEGRVYQRTGLGGLQTGQTFWLTHELFNFKHRCRYFSSPSKFTRPPLYFPATEPVGL